VLVLNNYVLIVRFNIILLLVILSFGIYVILSTGWVRNSKYSFLGAYRAIAQTISYEVVFIFIFITPLCLGSVYSFSELRNLGQNGVGGWV
jgi:NADH-quinone oxidoreductase subunit H